MRSFTGTKSSLSVLKNALMWKEGQDLRSTHHIAMEASINIISDGMSAEIKDGTLCNTLMKAKILFKA